MELSGALEEDPCAGYLVDDSDLEYSECSGESSGEEPVKRKESKREEEKESEDEFEREMEAEAILLLEQAAGMSSQSYPEKSTSGNADTCTAGQVSSKDSDEYYDEIYFDSSSDEEPSSDAVLFSGKKQSRKTKKLTNDELFYDPDMDDEDERWVQRQRMAYHNVRMSEKLQKGRHKDGGSQSSQQELLNLEGAAATPSRTSDSSEQNPGLGASKRLDSNLLNTAVPQSDAILSCPACMSTLCLDCQRHETYSNQYRAMFVLNCKIMMDEVLRYKPKHDRKSRKRRRDRVPATVEGLEAAEVYHPVRCSVCNTEVAVYDHDEVFHFFSVLASAP